MAEFATALQLAGLLLLVGAPGFWLALWRPAVAPTGARRSDETGEPLRRRLRLAVCIGAGAALLGAGLDVWRGIVPLTRGLSAGDSIALTGRFLLDTWLGTSRLVLAVAACAALPAALRLLRHSARPHIAIAAAPWLVTALAMIWTLAATGHAATGRSPFMAMTANALHLAAFLIWAGVLLGLVLMDWRRLAAGEGAATGLSVLLRRSSATALSAVSVLVAAGGVLAFVLALGLSATPAAAWQAFASDYGRLILLKSLLLAAALALAARNRFAILPALHAAAAGANATGATEAARKFARLVRLEALIVAGIVATTSMLAHTAPP